MSIWGYIDPVKDTAALKSAASGGSCPFCSARLVPLPIPESLPTTGSPFFSEGTGEYPLEYLAYGCEVCGWWRVARSSDFSYLHAVIVDWDAAAGSLKCL